MARPLSLGVRVLSFALGIVGALIPVALLLLDDIRYEPSTFLSYAAIFGVPGFLIPFLVTRAIGWFVQNRNP